MNVWDAEADRAKNPWQASILFLNKSQGTFWQDIFMGSMVRLIVLDWWQLRHN